MLKRGHQTTHTVFSEVSLTSTKSGKCGCNKHRVRQKKFYQTLNPFNKNARGVEKTVQEIYDELNEEIKQWKTEPITCEKCKDLPRP